MKYLFFLLERIEVLISYPSSSILILEYACLCVRACVRVMVLARVMVLSRVMVLVRVMVLARVMDHNMV